MERNLVWGEGYFVGFGILKLYGKKGPRIIIAQ